MQPPSYSDSEESPNELKLAKLLESQFYHLLTNLIIFDSRNHGHSKISYIFF